MPKSGPDTLKRKRVRISHPEDDSTDLWMFPYSTFMLILVILFVLLYGFSFRNSIEYEEALSDLASSGPQDIHTSDVRKEVAFAKNLKKIIADTGMADSSVITMSAQYINLKLNTPVMFDSGSAELRPDILPFLEKFYKALEGMGNITIVEGHTDNIPIHTERFNSNWELSAARAFSVMHFFIGKGIHPSRLVAHGYGEFKPVAPNDTEEGRAKNRRIEITIPRGT